MAVKKDVDNKYDPIKKKGLLSFESVEGDGQDLKDKLKEMKSRGIVVKHIDTEPASYKYTIWFFKDQTMTSDLNQEIWKDIPGDLFGVYQMSSLGRLRSIRTLSENNGRNIVLTDAKGNRKNVRIKKVYEQVFNKELDKEKPSIYQLRK